MAIIDNHQKVKLDKTFTDKHSDMFAFFDREGVDVDVCEDFVPFQTFINSLSKEDYPYTYDDNFSPDIMPIGGVFEREGFNLTLKKDDNIIATYASKNLLVKRFKEDFVEWFNCDMSELQKSQVLQFIPTTYNNSVEETFGVHPTYEISPENPADQGVQYYSSCQWVHQDYRGQKFGRVLDHLKKNICFDIFNARLQYAIHKESLKDYHLNDLNYSNSEWFATKASGDVFNIAWITKEEWTDKLDDVRKLYK
jgi:hypothetical protein